MGEDYHMKHSIKINTQHSKKNGGKAVPKLKLISEWNQNHNPVC